MFYRSPRSKVYVQALLPGGSEHWDEGRFQFNLAFSAISETFKVNLETANFPHEFMNLSSKVHVSLEPENPHTISLFDFEHPESCVYVTGNTRTIAPAFVMPAKEIVRVHVPVPNHRRAFETVNPEETLYGFQVLPIVLTHRYMQCNDTTNSE